MREFLGDHCLIANEKSCSLETNPLNFVTYQDAVQSPAIGECFYSQSHILLTRFVCGTDKMKGDG
ncbi:MAG: hypothetical protein CMK28_03980 [Porticoccaceae bacterium]|nr:hypothetical protein [Porticoccaceae bacterium]